MRNLLKESDTRVNGHPISFVDIDETTMHTFAKVNVVKNGKVVKSLDNKEFNTHQLGDGETYNFDNFKDAKFFNQTSQPIEKTIKRLKGIIQSIKNNKKQEKVIFLTARSDFDDKEVFLDTFRKFGIDVDIPNVHVERSGNLTDIKSVADRKKYVILKYLKSGLYTNAKMYDDDRKNLETFEELGKEINDGKYGILKNIKKNFPRVSKVNFYPLLVTNSGKIQTMESEDFNNKKVLDEDINAYHGSHKDFNEFDTKYVGTGEKCQAHGWGLYFALNADVSKGYQDRISSRNRNEDNNETDSVYTYNGKTYKENSIQGKVLKKLKKHGKSSALAFITSLGSEKQFSSKPEEYGETINRIYNIVNNINPKDIRETIKLKRGQFYTVSIPELNTYLDENKTMWQQSPEVIKSCKQVLKKINSPFKAKNLSGREFYNKLSYYSLEDGTHFDRGTSNDPKKISLFLYDNGITGIKYDGASDGDCVVIFNGKDVKIVNKDVDYEKKGDEIELSSLTKYIDDPKKLKNKRVSKEVIDWFLENRPQDINSKVFDEKLDDNQKFLYMVRTNQIRYVNDRKINLENVDKNSLEYKIYKLDNEIRSNDNADINYLKELINEIGQEPVEKREKLILRIGTEFLLLPRTDNATAIIVDYINNVFKDIKLEEFVKKFDTSNYMRFISISSYIFNQIDINELNEAFLFTAYYAKFGIGIFNFVLPNDNFSKPLLYALKLSKENESSNNVRNIVGNNIKVYNMEMLRDVLSYSKNGYKFILSKITEEDFRNIYTPELIKGYFNENDDDRSRYARETLIRLMFYCNAFDYINKLPEKDVVKFYYDMFSNINMDYDHCLSPQFLKNIKKSIRNKIFKNAMDNYFTAQGEEKIIENIKAGVFNNSYCMMCVINSDGKISKMNLLQYFNLPYEEQRELVKKNPYIIKYIPNPDKRLVDELRRTNPDIDDYVDYGD